MAVGKDQQPALLFRRGQPLPFLLHGVLRRVVKGRQDRRVQMMRRWHQVAQKDDALAAVIEHHHLMPLGRPRAYDNPQAGKNVRVPVQQFQLPPLRNGREVILPVGVAETLPGMIRLLPGGALHIVTGFGKSGDDGPGAVQASAAAAVVEMQIGKDYCVNILGGHPGGFQAFDHPAGHQAQGFLVPVIVLGADAGIDQDIFAVDLEQQAVQPQGNAVLAVGGYAVFPNHLGNRAENGSAVHFQDAVADDARCR